MTAPAQLAATAFTYAWWLTGDDNAAAAAALAAAGNLPTDPADDEALEALLREVRARAAPQRTMCPASELALLHDGQAVPLDVAADLVEIPAAEARVELAHGRLEALLETVTAPFAHAERLGGLAVGNPADVAHARTCTSCADAQARLRRGREELLALVPRPTPDAVRAGWVPDERPPSPAAGQDPDAGGGADEEREPVDAGEAGGSAGETGGASGRAPQISPGQRRGTLLTAFLVATALLLLLLTALSGEPPGSQAHAALVPGIAATL